MNNLHVKKGDTVMINSGADKGKKGKVLGVGNCEKVEELKELVEDNVGGVCGYGDSIDILAVIVSINLFHSGTGPSNSRGASPVVSIYLAPALVVGEVNGLCLCAGFIGCECRNSGKAHYHRKNENERKKYFSCVFHSFFLS